MLKIKRFALATLLISIFIVFFCQTIYSFLVVFKLVKVPEILYYLSVILVFDVVFIIISLGYQIVRDELKKRKEKTDFISARQIFKWVLIIAEAFFIFALLFVLWYGTVYNEGSSINDHSPKVFGLSYIHFFLLER